MPAYQTIRVLHLFPVKTVLTDRERSSSTTSINHCINQPLHQSTIAVTIATGELANINHCDIVGIEFDTTPIHHNLHRYVFDMWYHTYIEAFVQYSVQFSILFLVSAQKTRGCQGANGKNPFHTIYRKLRYFDNIETVDTIQHNASF